MILLFKSNYAVKVDWWIFLHFWDNQFFRLNFEFFFSHRICIWKINLVLLMIIDYTLMFSWCDYSLLILFENVYATLKCIQNKPWEFFAAITKGNKYLTPHKLFIIVAKVLCMLVWEEDETVFCCINIKGYSGIQWRIKRFARLHKSLRAKSANFPHKSVQ